MAAVPGSTTDFEEVYIRFIRKKTSVDKPLLAHEQKT